MRIEYNLLQQINKKRVDQLQVSQKPKAKHAGINRYLAWGKRHVHHGFAGNLPGRTRRPSNRVCLEQKHLNMAIFRLYFSLL